MTNTYKISKRNMIVQALRQMVLDDRERIMLKGVLPSDRGTVYQVAQMLQLKVKTVYFAKENAIGVEITDDVQQIEILHGDEADEAFEQMRARKEESNKAMPTQKELDVAEWKRVRRIQEEDRTEEDRNFMKYVRENYTPHEFH
jgi:DNA-binding CsgD family transcriptional regulator